MAQNVIAPLSQASVMVPEYQGGRKHLNYFLRQCELFISHYKTEDEHVNRMILEFIKAKITHDARDVLLSAEADDWDSIKHALKAQYSDSRSENLLLTDLTTSYMTKSQSLLDFHNQIKEKLKTLYEHVELEGLNAEIRQYKKNYFCQIAITAFKAGVLEPYFSHLKLVNIDTLENALLECNRVDNEAMQANFINSLRNKSNFTSKNPLPPSRPSMPLHKTPQSPMNYYHPLAFQQNPNFFNRPNPNFRNTNYSNGPTPNLRQITENRAHPANIPTSGQRQPQNNAFHGQRITPMSISTRNTYRPPQTQNQFVPRSRPTFTSRELHNAEYPTDNPTDLTCDDVNDQYYLDYEPTENFYPENLENNDADFREEASGHQQTS